MEMETKWNIYGEAQTLAELKNLILDKRGIIEEEDKSSFFRADNPLKNLLFFTNDFKDSLKKAREMVNKAVKEKTPILIMGDYDADGVCATAILYNFLTNELGNERTFYFVPDRFEHGYGLSCPSIDSALSKIRGVLGENPKTLIISVDSGITSVDEAAYIKELGHDLIITDHHQKPVDLPNADLIVWSDDVVGASIAWILAQILGSADQSSISLAALATVTDVHPLFGMSRSIVREGLKIINHNPPDGLRELMKISGLSGKKIGTYELGWVLGPRINAAGRLDDASQAVDLFTCGDPTRRLEIACELDMINSRRREQTLKMYRLSELSEDPPNLIFLSSDDYHEGIIGLVASRMVKEHHRPSIVISTSNSYGKGSARSIPGINIIEILRQFEDLFVNLGGHPAAAGFTVEKNNIPLLKEKMYEVFEKHFDEETFVRTLDVDAQIPMEMINWDLFDFLENLKPFGEGNRRPLFLSESVCIADLRFVGRDNDHVSLRISDGKGSFKAIHFNSKSKYDEVKVGGKADIVYSVKLNEFKGKRTLDLYIKSIRTSG